MASEANAIPPMTDDLSRYWKQPDLRDILIDDTHCILTQKQFNKLEEYSASYPSGVYSGKAWKRHDGAFDQRFLHAGGVPEWMLGWFGNHTEPETCSVHFRKILIDSTEEPRDE